MNENSDVRYIYLLCIVGALIIGILLAWPIIVAMVIIIAYAFIWTVAGLIVVMGIMFIPILWGVFAETIHPRPQLPLGGKVPPKPRKTIQKKEN